MAKVPSREQDLALRDKPLPLLPFQIDHNNPRPLRLKFRPALEPHQTLYPASKPSLANTASDEDAPNTLRAQYGPPPEYPLKDLQEAPLDSVARLIPRLPEYDERSGSRLGRIPTPALFSRARSAPSLIQLRKNPVWKRGTCEQQLNAMQEWFPDLPGASTTVTRTEYEAPKHKKSASLQSKHCSPESDIGLFGQLPAELRNEVYRLAVIEPDVVKVALQPNRCAIGACDHSTAKNTIPGIANSCRQLRWEVMPIFCAENTCFHFDYGMVREGCIPNYLKTMGEYVNLIQTFKFNFNRPCWNEDEFLGWATYTFTLNTPGPSNEHFTLDQSFAADARLNVKLTTVRPRPMVLKKVCQCSLDKALQAVNTIDHMAARWVLVDMFTTSENFSDFAWRMQKSKQFMQFLARCSKCKLTYFNN